MVANMSQIQLLAARIGGRRAAGLGLGLVLLAVAALAPSAGRADPSIQRAGTDSLGSADAVARRLAAWRALLQEGRSLGERAKLERVNRFFNRLRFVADGQPGSGPDHWDTPREFLARDGGDCEDFALAKYFTLRALGVPRQRLSLTDVRALRPQGAGRAAQAHMVLTYRPAGPSGPGGRALVLDNLRADILPLSRRADLLPVYSFNGAGLWLASRDGSGRRVGSAQRLSRWRELLGRMRRQASPVAVPSAY